MSGEPSADEIMAAIHESGYLMEQEVATQLERCGLHVRTNVAFEDPDEAKSREIDVVAVKRVAFNEQAKLAAYVELLVECKNSANPFVFIARPKNGADHHRVPEEIFPYRYEQKKDIGPNQGMIREVKGFHHLGFDQVFETHLNPWKAVQFCRTIGKAAVGTPTMEGFTTRSSILWRRR